MKIPLVILAVALACISCKKSETTPKAGAGGSAEDSAGTIPDDGAAVTLQVKWPVGNRYSQRLEVKGDTETTLPQSPKPMLQKMELTQEYGITVVRERELELEFESTELDVSMNGKSVVNVDTKAEVSGGEASNPMVASFRQAIGAKIRFLLDASNNVHKVEGFKEFVAKASAGSNPQSRATMQSMFSEDHFQQMVDFQRGLPRHPVKVGDTWPVQTDLNVPVLGALKLDVNYTFKGWESREKRKCAAIDFTGTMSSKGVPNAVAGGMTSKMESGTLSGKTWFDLELGNPVETQIKQDLRLHMTVPIPRSRTMTNAAAQTPTTQNITNHTKQTIVIKLADVVSAAN